MTAQPTPPWPRFLPPSSAHGSSVAHVTPALQVASRKATVTRDFGLGQGFGTKKRGMGIECVGYGVMQNRCGLLGNTTTRTSLSPAARSLPKQRLGKRCTKHTCLRSPQGNRLLDDVSFRICVGEGCSRPDAVVHSALVSTALSVATLLAYNLADACARSRCVPHSWTRATVCFSAVTAPPGLVVGFGLGVVAMLWQAGFAIAALGCNPYEPRTGSPLVPAALPCPAPPVHIFHTLSTHSSPLPPHSPQQLTPQKPVAHKLRRHTVKAFQEKSEPMTIQLTSLGKTLTYQPHSTPLDSTPPQLTRPHSTPSGSTSSRNTLTQHPHLKLFPHSIPSLHNLA